eukprot:345849-Amphidinium_carterae.1
MSVSASPTELAQANVVKSGHIGILFCKLCIHTVKPGIIQYQALLTLGLTLGFVKEVHWSDEPRLATAHEGRVGGVAHRIRYTWPWKRFSTISRQEHPQRWVSG